MECLVEGCDKTSLARGFCDKHYRRWRLYGDPALLVLQQVASEECTVWCCSDKAAVRGYCQKHYTQFGIRKDVAKPVCGMADCHRPLRANGLCSMHSKRFRKNGDPLKVVRVARYPSRACSVDGCASRRRKLTFCQVHYTRHRLGLDMSKPKRTRPGWHRNSDGYILLAVPEGTPGARMNKFAKHGNMFEHRYVMQKLLGRPLLKTENIHHINGKRDDNRPENLELWLRSQPCGQRVEDHLNWAREIINRYGDLVERSSVVTPVVATKKIRSG